MADALGSVRGISDGTGALVATEDFDVFGESRAATGSGSAFGFTGEQFDAETEYTYLRARYLDPSVGRFTQADTVQPNAPGTQGYNLYAYVANNPTTWVDPSGRFAPAIAWTAATIIPAVVGACLQDDRCREPMVEALRRLEMGGLHAAVGMPAKGIMLMVCVLYQTCRENAFESLGLVIANGSDTAGEGEGEGGGGSGGDPGGNTADPPPPFQNFPGPGPNGKLCLMDVYEWAEMFVDGVTVADGVTQYKFVDTLGHQWEVTIKENPAKNAPGDGSQVPRVSFKDMSKMTPGEGSFYDPLTNTWGGQRSPQAHVPLDTSC